MSLSIRKISQEPGAPEQEEGYSGVNSIWVVPERADLAGFSSRIFRMAPGGHTSMHAHEREHVALVLGGPCRVECGAEDQSVAEGHVMTIPPNVPHRFSNPSGGRLALMIMNFYIDPSKTAKPSEPSAAE